MSVADRWHTKKPRMVDGKPVERCREHKLYPSKEHKKGARWQVRWRNEEGDQCSENFARKEGKNPDIHADAFNKKIEGELQAGTYIDPNAGKQTFQEYAEGILKNRTLDPNSRHTISGRMTNHVYPAIGSRELRALSRRPSLIQNMVRGWEKAGLSSQYIHTILGNVSMVFACAVDDEAITKNPCKAKAVAIRKVVKRKVVPWTRDQVVAMRTALPRHYSIMVDIGAGAGLRQGEIFGLSPDDIDWDERVLHVRRQVKIIADSLVFALPKNNKERTVPLEEQLAADLERQVKEFKPVPTTLPWEDVDGEPRTVDLMFVNGRRRGIRRGAFNLAVWKPALVKAGIVPEPPKGEKVGDTRDDGMHALRHYFASALLTEGESVQAVAEWMGHHSPMITLNTYAHLMPKSEMRMRQIIGRALRPTAPEPSARNVPDEDMAAE